MRIATDDDGTLTGASAEVPVCLITAPDDLGRLHRAAVALGVADGLLGTVLQSERRRPGVRAQFGQVVVVAFATNAEAEPFSVYLHTTDSGMLAVLEDPDDEPWVRAAVESASDPLDALVKVLLAMAREAEDEADELAQSVRGAEAEAAGVTSTQERNRLIGMRSRVFTLQYLMSAQRRLLGPDTELSDAVPSAERALRQAGAGLDYASASLGQVYALLGDALARQSSVTNERLTLVNTIYLPLTLGTSFFGMNFGWMVDRVETASDFVVFGVLLPLLLSISTMLVVRQLGR